MVSTSSRSRLIRMSAFDHSGHCVKRQMPIEAGTFDVVYAPEVATDAAYRFRDDRFKRYGLLMIAACIVNLIGLSAALWFGARPRDASTLFIFFIVIVGPVWLLYEQFVWPQWYVSRLLRVLPSPGRISVSEDSISVTTVRRDALIPWTRIKRVLEARSAYVLVLSPFAFLFIPTTGLPAKVRDGLRARVALP